MQPFYAVSGLKNEPLQISTPLTTYLFQEENIHYAYLPALAATGYGYTSQEAWDSLNITLSEFLNYQKENAILVPELKRLGWNINNEMSSLIPPSNIELYTTDEQLQEIVNQVAYTTVSITVQFPSF